MIYDIIYDIEDNNTQYNKTIKELQEYITNEIKDAQAEALHEIIYGTKIKEQIKYDINNQEIKDNQNFIYIGGIAQYIFPYDKFTNYNTNQYINLWLQTLWQLSNKKTKKLIQTLGSISLDKKSNKL